MMDRGEKKATQETTRLLGKKETTSNYKAINPGNSDTVAGPSCGDDLIAAETSKTRERDEASQSPASEVLAAELAKEQRENEEKIADAVSSKFCCGILYGIWLFACHCLSSFVIQFSLLVLLLCLPISVGFMGARYMAQCPMNVKLPYAMMVVGCVGTSDFLVRITLLLHTKFSTNERLKNWLKKWTRLLDCLFFLSFLLGLYFTYEKYPSEDPLSLNYCSKRFYDFVCSMNIVLGTLEVVWFLSVCINKRCCIRGDAPP